MFVRFALALAVLIAPLAGAASAKSGRWRASWAASPAPPLASSSILPATALARSFNNQTVQQIIRLSAGGTGLRIRFTNEYGTRPLKIGAAKIALVDAKGVVLDGTLRTATFNGQSGAIIPSGAPWYSDAISLTVPPRSRVRISLYFPDETGLCTCHAVGGQSARVSPAGDHTGEDFVPTETFIARAFLSGVDVAVTDRKPVVVAFGDSITDGFQASIDQDKRWPDRLSERLAADRKFSGYGVVNAAISGNRILGDGMFPLFGQSAVERFDRDVLSVPDVSTVIVLEGINDIGQPRDKPVTLEELIGGYRQIIARAHAKGLKVIGGTLLPYKGAAYYRPQGNLIRKAVNQWILSSGNFDDVIDFDRIMRDPDDPDRMLPKFQSGDWLHPNDAGYEAMGNAVVLSTIR